ncbi:uncharacterized protein DFL_003795 [Arthrobotrys flagrans]|uniref:Uncharacterized protein n=1 Tax=Arthrobotrys flagrans TaxID=97331 RepID=A0A437A2W8_ARTFL|nr:hypothetical protein DFL_003795 [Arthrobotrys flagrans]
MRRFILSSSKGLAELTKSPDQTVQFIHESVRGFLLRENGLDDLRSEHGSLNSHEILKQCCFNYMKINMSNALQLENNLPLAATRYAWSLEHKEPTSIKFPFLEYAVLNVLYHADPALNSGHPQHVFTNELPLENGQSSKLLLHSFEGFGLDRAETGQEDCYKTGTRFIPDTSSLSKWSQGRGQRTLVAGFKHAIVDCYVYRKIPPRANNLIKNGHSLQIPNNQTLLSYATEHREWGWVELLLAIGKVDVDSRVKYNTIKEQGNRSPLAYAAFDGSFSMAKLLIDKGANIEAPYENRTPLSLAADAGHGTIVRLLFEKSAEVGAKYGGWTPLSYTAEVGHESIVSLLLGYGADIEANYDGRTPLSSTMDKGHKAIVVVLLENGAK